MTQVDQQYAAAFRKDYPRTYDEDVLGPQQITAWYNDPTTYDPTLKKIQTLISAYNLDRGGEGFSERKKTSASKNYSNLKNQLAALFDQKMRQPSMTAPAKKLLFEQQKALGTDALLMNSPQRSQGSESLPIPNRIEEDQRMKKLASNILQNRSSTGTYYQLPKQITQPIGLNYGSQPSFGLKKRAVPAGALSGQISGMNAIISKIASQIGQSSVNQILKSTINNPNSALWASMPGAQWSTTQDKWVGLQLKQPRQKNVALLNQLASQQASSADAIKKVSPFLSYMNDRLKTLGFSGIGKLNRNGSALFLGRWVNPDTKTLRSFPKVSYAYNPGNYTSVLVNKIFRAINRWNAFARAQDQVIKLVNMGQTRFEEKQQNKQNNLTIPKARKRSLLGIIRLVSLSSLKSNPLAYFSQPAMNRLTKALKNWDYGATAKALAQGANQALTTKGLSISMMKKLENLANWQKSQAENLAKRALAYGITQPMTRANFNRQTPQLTRQILNSDAQASAFRSAMQAKTYGISIPKIAYTPASYFGE